LRTASFIVEASTKLTNGLEYLGFLRTGPLGAVPIWAAIPLFWILSDFIFY